jgi:hypothetical protein
MSPPTSWLTEPELPEGETILWRSPANRTQRWRAVGGCLYLTDSWLLFEPNKIDARIGGRRWSIKLVNIRGAGAQSPNGGILSGGLRTRLRLDLAAGDPELFVVRDVHSAAAVINEAIHSE